jgi:hypothetical protein
MFLGLGLLLFLFWGILSKIIHKQPIDYNYMVLLGFAIFAPVVILAELRPEEFLGKIATFVSFSVIYAAIFFINKEAAVVIIIIRSIISGILNKFTWYSTLFNTAQGIIAVGLAGFLFDYAKTPGVQLLGITDVRLAFVAVALSFSVINVILVYVYVRLVGNFSNETLTFNLQWKDIKTQSVIFAAFLLVILYKQSPLLLILMLVPALIILYMVRNYRRLQTETMKTLEALASGIEQRYGYSYQHTTKVVEYAVKLARRLKLARTEVDTLEAAAKIHDLGKVSIADEILQKPGPLSPEEFETIKAHSVIGSEIAAKLSAYKPGIRIIRHHHEWYDGSGYPDGLKGDEIPMGARILTIADAYDAMTNARPYRAPLEVEEVLEQLQKGKGSHYDPRLVDQFCELIQEELQEAAGKGRSKGGLLGMLLKGPVQTRSAVPPLGRVERAMPSVQEMQLQPSISIEEPDAEPQAALSLASSQEPVAQPQTAPAPTQEPITQPQTAPSLAQKPIPQPQAPPSLAQKPIPQPQAPPSLAQKPIPQPQAPPSLAQKPIPQPQAPPPLAQKPIPQPQTAPLLSQEPIPQPQAAPSLLQKPIPQPRTAPSLAQKPIASPSLPPPAVPSRPLLRPAAQPVAPPASRESDSVQSEGGS